MVHRVRPIGEFLEELERLGVDEFSRRYATPVLLHFGDADASTVISDNTVALELPPVGESGWSIGRSSAADVTLALTGLSKKHVALRLGAGGFVLEDLGSKNGTYLDGRQLSAGERVAVRDGAVIALGPYSFGVYSPERFLDVVAAVSGGGDGAGAGGLSHDTTTRDPQLDAGGRKWGTLHGTLTRRSIQGRLEAALEELTLTDETGLEAVMEISRYLSSIRSLSELLEKILESMVRVMGAERGALVQLAEDDGGGVSFRCITAHGLAPSKVVEGSNEISFGIIREAHRSGEAILTDNALADERFRERMSVMATVIRSVLCGPIRTRTRTLGFVYLDRRITAVPFDENHRDLLAALCTQVAVAWENALAFEEIEALNASLEQKVEERTQELVDARLKLAEAQRDALEAEMTLARQIQQSILPPEDTFERPGLLVRGRVIPASFCGGDFWWMVGLGEKTLLFIADVTGHGVAASMITAVAGACLDTLTDIGSVRSVSDVLRTLNRVVYRSAGGRLCATAFCALFDPADKRLEFTGAGHNFPYVLRPGEDAPRPLIARGARLGEQPEREYERHSAVLSAGERLVLFSDGLVEWEDAGGRVYGNRRFLRSIQAHRAVPIAETIDRYIGDAEAFSAGVERDDDLSVVVVDVL